MALASVVVLKVGAAYKLLAFNPEFHGGWLEALWAGGVFDWEGTGAFAGTAAGKCTYFGGYGLLIGAVLLFWLAWRSD